MADFNNLFNKIKDKIDDITNNNETDVSLIKKEIELLKADLGYISMSVIELANALEKQQISITKLYEINTKLLSHIASTTNKVEKDIFNINDKTKNNKPN